MLEVSLNQIVKCGFSVENFQLVPADSGEPIANKKHGTTDPYKTTYFNMRRRFIYVNLKIV